MSVPIKRIGPSVLRCEVEIERGNSPEFLIISDVHWDNPYCDRELLTSHLSEAKRKGAPILILGDFFCAMQGTGDPRAAKGDIRPEHLADDYLDSLVTTASDYLEPYADLIYLFGKGNHEMSVRKRKEVDLIERTCAILKSRTGAAVPSGGYGGWVVFNTSWKSKNPEISAKHRTTGGKTRSKLVRLAWTHGSGGGGPVTKGTIQASRRALYLPDADIVCSGHIHESWMMEFARERMTNKGEVYFDIQTHLCTGTYKQEYDGKGESWHRQMGRPPKPLGGWWVSFRHGAVPKKGPTPVLVDARRAS